MFQRLRYHVPSSPFPFLYPLLLPTPSFPPYIHPAALFFLPSVIPSPSLRGRVDVFPTPFPNLSLLSYPSPPLFLLYHSSQGEAECAFYMRTGMCKYGATCRFHHPVLPFPLPSPSPSPSHHGHKSSGSSGSSVGASGGRRPANNGSGSSSGTKQQEQQQEEEHEKEQEEEQEEGEGEGRVQRDNSRVAAPDKTQSSLQTEVGGGGTQGERNAGAPATAIVVPDEAQGRSVAGEGEEGLEGEAAGDGGNERETSVSEEASGARQQGGERREGGSEAEGEKGEEERGGGGARGLRKDEDKRGRSAEDGAGAGAGTGERAGAGKFAARPAQHGHTYGRGNGQGRRNGGGYQIYQQQRQFSHQLQQQQQHRQLQRYNTVPNHVQGMIPFLVPGQALSTNQIPLQAQGGLQATQGAFSEQQRQMQMQMQHHWAWLAAMQAAGVQVRSVQCDSNVLFLWLSPCTRVITPLPPPLYISICIFPRGW